MAPNEEELYQEHILDHYEDPYHRGKCRTCTHIHEDTNLLCGDVIRMELQIDDRGTMKEVYFNGNGCCISQAAASMLAEKFDGKTVEEVKQFTAKDMLDLFGARGSRRTGRSAACFRGGFCRRQSIRPRQATRTDVTRIVPPFHRRRRKGKHDYAD